MNLFVLSELQPENQHVGWAVNYTLETTLASACKATFLYPVDRDKIVFLKRYRQRLFKSWFEITDLPVLGEGLNVLLIVGIEPKFLLSMHALGPLLKKFDCRIAYLLDGFEPADLDRSIIAELDHLFVISAEVSDEVNRALPIATSFLPLATDALRLGSHSRRRCIDIVSYGRTDAALHQCLRSHYTERETDRVYFHSTFSQPTVHSLGEHVTTLAKLLSRSQISLCFEPSYIKRFRGYSPILFRWFEGWAAGCTIVGKKPFGKDVAPLMDWENSAIELPDQPAEWVLFFEALLDDNASLVANSQRNYRECLLRHDWRYRLQEMFRCLDLPLPAPLSDEIVQLKQKVDAVPTFGQLS